MKRFGALQWEKYSLVRQIGAESGKVRLVSGLTYSNENWVVSTSGMVHLKRHSVKG